MKRKGFTLVELLAVIVILAVIALIAVPQVMKIINQSREDAERQSRLGVTKAFELGIGSGKYQVDTEYKIEDIEADNNPFLSGVIIYDSKTKDIYYSHAVNKKTEVNESGSKSALNEPINNNDNSLAKQLIKAVGTDKTSEYGYYDATDGYIKGGTLSGTKNFIKIPETDNLNALYRAVRIHPDGRVLVVRNASKTSKKYDDRFDWNSYKCTLPCTNNFAGSTIKEYLNNDFYPLISNKKIITETIWDTRCYSLNDNYKQCLSGPTTTVTKVGLLTLEDVLKVGVKIYDSSTTYLYIVDWWWLGTGYSYSSDSGWYDSAWYVGGDGDADDIDFVVNFDLGVRPAFTLSSDVIVTNNGNGSENSAFEITSN